MRLMVWAAAALLAMVSAAGAQPSTTGHTITLVVTVAAGGGSDAMARLIAERLQERLKQPVVVETKAGAGGQVGAQVGASAKPDGYTLLSHNNGISGYEEVDKLFGRQPKTTRADFIPLARLVASRSRSTRSTERLPKREPPRTQTSKPARCS